ncbi:unnamed protein product [Merluccius merluccius]
MSTLSEPGSGFVNRHHGEADSRAVVLVWSGHPFKAGMDDVIPLPRGSSSVRPGNPDPTFYFWREEVHNNRLLWKRRRRRRRRTEEEMEEEEDGEEEEAPCAEALGAAGISVFA